MLAFGGAPWQFSLMGMVTVPLAPWANKDVKARIEGIDHRLAAFEWQKADFVNQIRGNLADRLVMMQTLQEQIDRYERDIIPNQREQPAGDVFSVVPILFHSRCGLAGVVEGGRVGSGGSF